MKCDPVQVPSCRLKNLRKASVARHMHEQPGLALQRASARKLTHSQKHSHTKARTRHALHAANRKCPCSVSCSCFSACVLSKSSNTTRERLEASSQLFVVAAADAVVVTLAADDALLGHGSGVPSLKRLSAEGSDHRLHRRRVQRGVPMFTHRQIPLPV